MSEIKDVIKNNIIGDGYVLTHSHMFDYKTLCERYEKVLAFGATNPYDSYLVFIDIEHNTLLLLYKNSNDFELEDRPPLCIDTVLASAEKLINREIQDYDIMLSVVNDSDLYPMDENDNHFRLAYIIKTNTEEIYIDAYTNEAIGIDFFKTIYGGAVAIPDFTTSDQSISMAKSSLQNLGFNTTSSIKTAYLHSVVPNYLNVGFYISSHGSSSSLASHDENVSSSDRYFYPYQVSSSYNYKFVFLDACNTAANSTWSNAFGIYNTSSGKAFLGWTDSVGIYASFSFCLNFWSSLVTADAVSLAATQACAMSSPYYVPISFTGDYGYDGHY